MTIRRIFLLSFLISLGIWAWFSWPLPRHLASGVPAAAHLEPAEVRPLIPGDHLQFMYYCWLAGDMLAGKTPLFCNPYEFNMGEAFARRGGASGEAWAKPSDLSGVALAKTEAIRAKGGGYRPDAYYFPFSLIYAAAAYLGGRALGWNITGFISLWMTFFLTWLLVRRYARPDGIAGCAALIAIILPFRWINLCGGSPAGFACLWIPAILLGIDLAVRDGKAAGGLLAGVSILFASWTDNHIFFFGTLAVPVWTLIALAAEFSPSAFLFNGRAGQPLVRRSSLSEVGCPAAAGLPVRPYLLERESWQKIFIALLPVPLFLGLALAFPMIMQQIAGPAADQFLGSSVDKRLLREIALYSPARAGFFGWFTAGASSHIYIGLSALVFLVAGWIFTLINAFRGRSGARQAFLIMALLTLSIIGIMELSLGTNGHFQAVFLRACRKLIPPYAMIRQPAKIFCLMPAFLAVAAGLGLGAIFLHLKTTPAKFLAALVFCGAIGAEYALRLHPTVSTLDSKQGAYAAVAEDAAKAGKPPHALVVPLWPGDTHYSSIYQYYASLYRVRMVNGYNPFVSKSYFENVFCRYESVNQGWLTGSQLDELLERGIDYLVLHEDLFPEKVSPFPVGWTLKQFLLHPRLRLLKQDGRAWAFKMLAAPDTNNKSGPNGITHVGTTISASNMVGQTLWVSRSSSDGSAGPSASLRAGTPRPTNLKSSDAQLKLDHWSIFGCARHWQAEACARGAALIRRDDAPERNVFALLEKPGAGLLVSSGRGVAPAPGLRWMVRIRGEGSILAETATDRETIRRDLLEVASDQWSWLDLPLADLDRFAPLGLKLEHDSGSIECDRVLLTAGQWIPPARNEIADLPAPAMFHAGYTSLEDNAVVLEKEREERALIFYGPKLPLEKGRYRVELVFSSSAPKGTLLGQFNIKRHDRDIILNWIPVVAGAQSPAEFTQTVNEPMHLEFRFLGNGSLKINSIRLTRLE